MVGRYVFVINSAHPACCPTRSVLLGADLDANQHEVYCWVQIWMQTKGRVSHFVAGGSTGGTISGTGRFLKDMNPKIKVMLPDPVGSVFWDFWANRKAEKDLEAKSYQVDALSCLVMQNRLFLCH
jgi:cysteine synthase